MKRPAVVVRIIINPGLSILLIFACELLGIILVRSAEQTDSRMLLEINRAENRIKKRGNLRLRKNSKRIRRKHVIRFTVIRILIKNLSWVNFDMLLIANDIGRTNKATMQSNNEIEEGDRS